MERLERRMNNKLLLESARKGDLKTIKLMVELNLNYVDEDKSHALHRAVWKGHLAIVEYLVLNGANVEARAENGETPLFMAVKLCHIEIAKTLVRLGAKTDVVNKKGGNLLDAAMLFCRVNMIKFVLELNLNISANQYGELLSASARNCDLETIKSLVELNCVNSNYVCRDKSNALHRAVWKGHLAIVEYLVLNGANVEARDENGETPLFMAVKHGFIEVAKTLVRLGAKTDAVNKNGENLLDAVFTYGFLESLRFVVDLGFDINQYDRKGFTPLIRAIKHVVSLVMEPRKDHVSLLLKSGADYRKYSIPDGLSPMHFIISEYRNHASLIKLLIEHVEICEGETGMLDYVDYNGNTEGQTALHIACIKRDCRAVKILLHCGANPNIKDKSGKLAYDYVRCNAHPEDPEAGQIRSVLDETGQSYNVD